MALVLGNVVRAGPLTENENIRQSLHWIGFRTNAQRTSVVNDAFDSFIGIKMLTEKDITAMERDYGTRATAARIVFGTRRTKLLKAFVLWTKDFYRISSTPSVVGLSEDTFKAELQRAISRSDIRANIKAQTPIQAPLASPGPLDSEIKWKQWEEKFNNYTRLHIGSNGVPLSYVIRELDVPDPAAIYTDFITQSIACAPLTGELYQADRTTVFNMIVSFTTGQPSGDWIKNTIRYADGRRSMKALRDHFSGEGNVSRTIGEATRLRDTLHYKGERSMKFETFLTQCQKMFNIFETQGEAMTDAAKVRFLFSKVQHPELKSPIDALKAQITGGAVVTYVRAANHLSAALSDLPEYVASGRRGISLVHTGDKGSDSIYNKDGSIITGYIPDWNSLSRKDRSIVIAERKKLGVRGPSTRGKGPNQTAMDANRMKQLETQNKKYKRAIKALQAKRTDDETASTADDDDSVDLDAGDQFGGKNSKKQKRK